MCVPGEELEVAGDVGGVAGLAGEPQLLLVLGLVHGAVDYAIVSGGTCYHAGPTVPIDADGQAGIGDREECREEDDEELELHSNEAGLVCKGVGRGGVRLT